MNNEDLNTLLFCSFRYALGRRTYITHTISELIIKYWDKINRRTKIQIQDEINEAIAHKMAGGPCDEVQWRKILELEW